MLTLVLFTLSFLHDCISRILPKKAIDKKSQESSEGEENSSKNEVNILEDLIEKPATIDDVKVKPKEPIKNEHIEKPVSLNKSNGDTSKPNEVKNNNKETNKPQNDTPLIKPIINKPSENAQQNETKQVKEIIDIFESQAIEKHSTNQSNEAEKLNLVKPIINVPITNEKKEQNLKIFDENKPKQKESDAKVNLVSVIKSDAPTKVEPVKSDTEIKKETNKQNDNNKFTKPEIIKPIIEQNKSDSKSLNILVSDSEPVKPATEAKKIETKPNNEVINKLLVEVKKDDSKPIDNKSLITRSSSEPKKPVFEPKKDDSKPADNKLTTKYEPTKPVVESKKDDTKPFDNNRVNVNSIIPNAVKAAGKVETHSSEDEIVDELFEEIKKIEKKDVKIIEFKTDSNYEAIKKEFSKINKDGIDDENIVTSVEEYFILKPSEAQKLQDLQPNNKQNNNETKVDNNNNNSIISASKPSNGHQTRSSYKSRNQDFKVSFVVVNISKLKLFSFIFF